MKKISLRQKKEKHLQIGGIIVTDGDGEKWGILFLPGFATVTNLKAPHYEKFREAVRAASRYDLKLEVL